MDKLIDRLPEKSHKELSDGKLSLEAAKFYTSMQEEAKYMFGYPAHRYPISLKTQYLLLQHYTAPFSNNCGDIDERGNYAMDTKDIEKRIVQLYAEKFSMGENFWGYVTSGGSESNSCGIVLAFSQNPNGILYYSSSAHYSVEKYAKTYEHEIIPCLPHDVLDVKALLERIKYNYDARGAAANLLLTHGTTKYGACDEVDEIVAFLRAHNIPYYIHVDAALFGGIPNNQIDAPLFLNAKERGINSISVSLHKYTGFPDVKSVFVATEKPRGETVAYIGQHDTTVSGSRSIPAFALLNHITEQLNEPDPEQYVRNVHLFESLLKEAQVPYYKAEFSNIFVIDSPSDKLCKKYQLSCFEEDGKQKAHVIIFASHFLKEMQELVTDLKQDLR